MPFQNRVFPDQSLRAITARGALLGNRGGRFHKDDQTLRAREYASKQWIYCVLDFKNRTRAVFGQGYTELFFACEASAFASGHRPCFECQRERAKSFQQLFQKTHGLSQPPKAVEMDAILHAERFTTKPFVENLDALPNGAMIAHEGVFYLKKSNHWHQWQFEGLKTAKPVAGRVLTPPTLLAILAAGFEI
jgi:hypothetical protein